MPLTPALETRLLRAVDRLFGRLFWPAPARSQWAQVRLVAHRGVHDGHLARENSLAAFAAAADLGLWGVELDLRWSADAVALVCHDPVVALPGGGRVSLRQLSFQALRARLPGIPTLAEVVNRYGGKLHLMIELKADSAPEAAAIHRQLAQWLAPLEACRDYHLISEDLDLLARLQGIAPAALLPIARFNVLQASQRALALGWGGITGHLLMVGQTTINRHQRAGQAVGTGFVNARASLFREVRRGVQWVFSDRARAIQALLRQLG